MTTLVFGVFDLLHPGHHYFCQQAKRQNPSNSLVVVVTRDVIVKQLKSLTPTDDQETRLRNVLTIPEVDQATLGDETLGLYRCIFEYGPSLICLGHDQDGLEKDLRRRMESGHLPPIELHRCDAYRRDLYSSTRLRQSR